MRVWAMLGVCAVATTAGLVGVLLAFPEWSERVALAAWAQVLTEAAGCVACLAAADHTRGRARRVWLLFAVAEGIWMCTDAALGYTTLAGIEVPEVSLLDAGWLSFYLPAGLATILLYMRLRPERGAQGVVDGLIITVGAAAVAWTTAIGGLANSVSGGLAGALVVALYPALDLLCAMTLGWIVLRHRRRAPSWVLLVVTAFIAQTVAGIAYLVSIVPGHDLSLLSVAAFVAAAWLWVAAGVARLRAPQRAWAAATRDRPPAWSERVPFVVALLVVGLAALRPDPELRVAAVVVSALAAVRAIGAMRVGRGLLAERDRLLVTDPLTGVFNRRFLGDEIDRAIARADRAGEPLAAIAFDLDRFKQVNDRFGHETGDLLLRVVCEALGVHLRAGDVLCRLGGDEFLILCAGTDGPGALATAERVRVCVVQSAGDVVPDVPVSASLGVAVFPADGRDAATLLRNADTALYAAKGAGRNVVVRAAGATTGPSASV